MGLTNELVGSKIVAKIKIYVLARAELLFNLCYEIPCSLKQLKQALRTYCPLIGIYCARLAICFFPSHEWQTDEFPKE